MIKEEKVPLKEAAELLQEFAEDWQCSSCLCQDIGSGIWRGKRQTISP